MRKGSHILLTNFVKHILKIYVKSSFYKDNYEDTKGVISNRSRGRKENTMAKSKRTMNYFVQDYFTL